MEEQVGRLVAKLQAKISATERLLIAVSGIPGSGKTSLAASVVNRLNANHSSLAAFVPMDGYHLSRAQLSAMPDPTHAHARRGAEFTFDGPSFLALVKAVRSQTPNSPTLYAPSFDHAIKDPKENDIPILASTKVIIFEGNYLSLDKEPWKEAAGLMDEVWFVDVDFEVARRRLVERHIRTGVAPTEGEAEKRVKDNDLINGEEIVKRRIRNVDEVIISREDDGWKPQAQGQ